VPNKIDADGNLIEDSNLEHFYRHQHRDKRHRFDDTVRYSLYFNGMKHFIELMPNHDFVSSSIAREFHSESRVKRGDFDEMNLMCYYTGRVRDIDDSRVAISTCHGLVSI
jgi:hypothetical protein